MEAAGRLSFAVADRVLMQERAIYSVIAPEGAAAILYRDASRAPELADRLKITAPEVRESCASPTARFRNPRAGPRPIPPPPPGASKRPSSTTSPS